MATLPSQNMQSVRLLCFFSLDSLIFPSQISSLKFPIFSPIKIKPTKLCTSSNGSSQLVGRASASQFSADMGDILGDVSIFTVSQLLGSLSFPKTFGTKTNWERALELKESKARFDSVGVKLIAIGVRIPNKACMLAERLPFPMDCLYADPDHKAYNVLGLYHGFDRTLLNTASIKVFSRFEALQKAVKNYTIEAIPDDRSSVLQQGGMFVFKGKQLLYARKDEGTGDHAPLDDVFDACCKSPTP